MPFMRAAGGVATAPSEMLENAAQRRAIDQIPCRGPKPAPLHILGC